MSTTYTKTGKRSTRRTANKAPKLSPSVARRVSRIHGACTGIARLAGCSRQYVWDVVHFNKPPSEKLKHAIAAYIDREGELMQHDAMRFELAEMERAEVGAR